MATMTTALTVRPYLPEDRAAVRHVCFETGYLGNSAEQFYRDPEGFADLFSSYYTDAEPQHAMVAELAGEVVGYMLNCLTTKNAWSHERLALTQVVKRGACFRAGTAGFYWRGLMDMLRDVGKAGRPRFDMARYPSHTHINLLPIGRAGGAGMTLMMHSFDLLRSLGSPGLHGECAAENERALEYFTKVIGFSKVGEPYIVPAMRTSAGERQRIQLLVRDLTSWIPGAWRTSDARAVLRFHAEA